jgi:hypothetical protein
MAKMVLSAKELAAKLRGIELLASQGRTITDAMQETGLTELTYYPRWHDVQYVEPAFPIAYLHIPRTAGTSLSRVLSEHWRRVVLVPRWHNLRDLPEKEIERALLLYGHFRAYQLERPLFSRFRVITVLRDPLDRVISSYRYGFRRAVVEADSNSYAAMRFAARVNFVEWFYSKYGIDRHAQLYMLGLNAGEQRHQMSLDILLERAKMRLDRMVVGLFEQIDLYMGLLEKVIGLPNVNLPRVNTTEGIAEDRIKISNAELAAMRAILAPDYALYQYAKERFDRLCQDAQFS